MRKYLIVDKQNKIFFKRFRALNNALNWISNTYQSIPWPEYEFYSLKDPYIMFDVWDDRLLDYVSEVDLNLPEIIAAKRLHTERQLKAAAEANTHLLDQIKQHHQFCRRMGYRLVRGSSIDEEWCVYVHPVYYDAAIQTIDEDATDIEDFIDKSRMAKILGIDSIPDGAIIYCPC